MTFPCCIIVFIFRFLKSSFVRLGKGQEQLLVSSINIKSVSKIKLLKKINCYSIKSNIPVLPVTVFHTGLDIKVFIIDLLFYYCAFWLIVEFRNS